MASTFQGGSASSQPQQQQPSALPVSMIGFGPSAQPFYSAVDAGTQQRLQQHYSTQQQQQQQQQSQQPQQHQVSPPAQPAGSRDVLSGRRSGKVKFFDTQKGFGFINDYRPEELGNEEEYDIVRGPKGFQAANVTGPGGQQVIGDSRNRQQSKSAYLPISPYAAMYPYIQQDPTSFYAASPYAQPLVLMPQADFRGSASVGPGTFRPASYAASPSPYASPAPIRGYDISKEFANMGLTNQATLGGLASAYRSMGRPTDRPTGQQPFGGMFGAIPSFDAPVGQSLAPSTTVAGPSSSSSNPFAHTYPSLSASTNTMYGRPAANQTGSSTGPRSNSLDAGDNAPPAPRTAPSNETGKSERLSDAPVTRPPNHHHSRSSSLLYSSKPSSGLG